MSGKKQAATVKDIPAAKFIAALAAHFKTSGKVDVPAWNDLVKTGPNRELPPQSADWYFVRMASIARRVYINSGLGVGALAKSYGGSAAYGVRAKHHRDAARGNIRSALHALEKLTLVAKKDGSKGRYITAAGKRELDTVATRIVDLKPAFGLALTPTN